MIIKTLAEMYEFTKNRRTNMSIGFNEKPIKVTNPIEDVFCNKGIVTDTEKLEEYGYIVNDTGIYIPANTQCALFWGQGLEPHQLECLALMLNTILEDPEITFVIYEEMYPQGTKFD